MDVALQPSGELLERANTRCIGGSGASPFVKWAGGKRVLVPYIMQEFPESFNDYYEPFLGGGAVFFGLGDRITKKAFLSDLNADLMCAYKILKKDPKKVIAKLERHRKKHCADYYSKIRDEEHGEYDPVKLAARFIYLNKTCFNGLYRVNKSGKFNVPMGSYVNPKICDTVNLLHVSIALTNARLKVQSFDRIKPSSGDLVYCDPPYDETFSQYTEKGFLSSDQELLRECCDLWQKRGAYVIVSSSDTEFIRKTWRGYRFIEIQASRNINCVGSERGKVTELLIIGKNTKI